MPNLIGGSVGTKIKAVTAVGIVLVLAIIAGAVLLFNATSISTQPDQTGLWYKAGPLSSTEYDHCVPSGQRELFGGLADDTYIYPAGQRTYDFSANGAQDIPPIRALSKNNLELTVSGIITFNMTEDCELLKKFHEEIGIKDEAYTPDGWRVMLAKYLQQSLHRAVNEATQQYNWQQLYNDVEIKAQWEKEVSEALPVFVKSLMRDEYFTNYTMTIQKPELPAELVDALRETQVAVEQNNAQKERNATITTELESIEKLVRILGPEGYNVYQAIKDGKIPVMPIPSGSGVNINAAPSGPLTQTAEPEVIEVPSQ